jgi:hypothetical protein
VAHTYPVDPEPATPRKPPAVLASRCSVAANNGVSGTPFGIEAWRKHWLYGKGLDRFMKDLVDGFAKSEAGWDH